MPGFSPQELYIRQLPGYARVFYISGLSVKCQSVQNLSTQGRIKASVSPGAVV